MLTLLASLPPASAWVLILLLLAAALSVALKKMDVVGALAGIAGNLTDSLLGATWQRQGWLDNHGVNLVSTAVAAIVSGVLQHFLM